VKATTDHRETAFNLPVAFAVWQPGGRLARLRLSLSPALEGTCGVGGDWRSGFSMYRVVFFSRSGRTTLEVSVWFFFLEQKTFFFLLTGGIGSNM
jgi:hypothetical protein